MRQIEELSIAALGGISPHVDPELAAAEKPFVASLTTSPQYARDGLVKKTLCIGPYHVVSYFSLDDVQNGRLPMPSETEDFAGVSISQRLQSMAIVAASTHAPRKSSQTGSDADEAVGSEHSISQSAISDTTALSPSTYSWISPVSDKGSSLPNVRETAFQSGDAHHYHSASRNYWPVPSRSMRRSMPLSTLTQFFAVQLHSPHMLNLRCRLHDSQHNTSITRILISHITTTSSRDHFRTACRTIISRTMGITSTRTSQQLPSTPQERTGCTRAHTLRIACRTARSAQRTRVRPAQPPRSRCRTALSTSQSI